MPRLKPVLITSGLKTQKALKRIETLSASMGMSKCQAACFLIENAPEPLDYLKKGTHDPAHQ